MMIVGWVLWMSLKKEKILNKDCSFPEEGEVNLYVVII